MIQVGDWIHVQPQNLDVQRIDPTQLNHHKNRVQEPFFRLLVGDGDGQYREVMVNGYKMFWSLLDALFPYDKLPRIPVNNALQADANSFVHDLNEFFLESTTPYISIMLGQIDDPYSTVEGQWCRPGATIITANSGLKAPDCVAIADRYHGLIIPGTWRDSKGSHQVPCVLVNGCIHIHDLGNKLVVGSVLTNEHMDTVRPLPPDTIKKGVGWDALLASVIEKHSKATEEEEGRLYPPQIKRNWIYDSSSEIMAKEVELFKRGHQE